MIQAALFDMDGLLFDTEELGTNACLQIGRERGFALTRECVLETLGMNAEGTNAHFSRCFPGFDGDCFWRDVLALLRDYTAKNGTPVKAYAREILADMRGAGIRTALVSSSDKSIILHYLKHAGMENAFPVMITGDMGLKGKPAPDMYLRAAELLGAAPARCVVLEDSPNGLASGRAAGMVTVMVPDLIPCSAHMRENCDHVCATLREASALIREGVCR